MVPGVLYALLNVKKIVDVVLFPGMVTVVEGSIVKSPVSSLPVQKRTSRLAYCRLKELPLGPPRGFQTTWTLETVSVSCGFMIHMLMLLPFIMIFP
jgi:hypothetical protein